MFPVKIIFALFLFLGAIPTMIGLKCYVTNPLNPENVSLTVCQNGNDAACGKTIGKMYKMIQKQVKKT